MRAQLEALAGQYSMYTARRDDFAVASSIPFRVSPEPLRMSHDQKDEIERIGVDMVAFTGAIDDLYHYDGEVRALLNRGKPAIFTVDRPSHYLFIRPDLIVYGDSFTVCEVETSPFGLGLSHLLNRAYTQEGFQTMVDDVTLPDHVRARTPSTGTIIHSKKTQQYAGQLTYLADQVFSGQGRQWDSVRVEDNGVDHDEYRAFYLSEYQGDPAIHALLDRSALAGRELLTPGLTPHLEEKAILALLWDKRYDAHLRQVLGEATVRHLRTVVPPTWIVGQETHFIPGLPDGIQHTAELAGLSRAKRTMVLKTSGFSNDASWAEGVTFLHEQSADNTGRILHEAEGAENVLYVVQEFRKGTKMPIEWEDAQGNQLLLGRVRVTPYFDTQTGKLLTIKATIRARSDLIHGSSDSVNTAVM